MSENILAKAADNLRHGWCRGTFRNDAVYPGHRTQFCAIGALVDAAGLVDWNNRTSRTNDYGHEVSDISWALERLAQTPEAVLLQEIILEQHPELTEEFNEVDTEPIYNIIQFNDYHAESADDVLAVFEKAAARWEERV